MDNSDQDQSIEEQVKFREECRKVAELTKSQGYIPLDALPTLLSHDAKCNKTLPELWQFLNCHIRRDLNTDSMSGLVKAWNTVLIRIGFGLLEGVPIEYPAVEYIPLYSLDRRCGKFIKTEHQENGGKYIKLDEFEPYFRNKIPGIDLELPELLKNTKSLSETWMIGKDAITGTGLSAHQIYQLISNSKLPCYRDMHDSTKFELGEIDFEMYADNKNVFDESFIEKLYFKIEAVISLYQLSSLSARIQVSLDTLFSLNESCGYIDGNEVMGTFKVNKFKLWQHVLYGLPAYIEEEKPIVDESLPSNLRKMQIRRLYQKTPRENVIHLLFKPSEVINFFSTQEKNPVPTQRNNLCKNFREAPLQKENPKNTKTLVQECLNRLLDNGETFSQYIDIKEHEEMKPIANHITLQTFKNYVRPIAKVDSRLKPVTVHGLRKNQNRT